MRSEIKSDNMPRTFRVNTLQESSMKDFFLRVASCEFIQMNRRSASFECSVEHFERLSVIQISARFES